MAKMQRMMERMKRMRTVLLETRWWAGESGSVASCMVFESDDSEGARAV